MAINLSALSQATTAATALSNLILVSPQKTVGYQPQNAPSWLRSIAAQPATLLFNYEGEQTAALTCDITDHFIEDNTAVQDQIAIKPNIITTQGFVGELNDIAPSALAPLQIAASKLTVISAYTPGLSVTALLAYNAALQAYQTAQNALNTAVSTWASINGSGGESVISGGGIVRQPNQTQQQIYFQQFYAYLQQRTFFTIQTPWAIFQDMAIQSLRAIQSADTRMISDFEVTFKQMRFASTISISATLYSDTTNFDGRASAQASASVNLGVSTLQPSSVSYSSLLGGG